MNQFKTVPRPGSFSSITNIREGASSTTPLLTPTGSVLSMRNPSPTDSVSSLANSWAIPSKGASMQALNSGRTAIYDSFVTVKADLKSGGFSENQLQMAQNVARSRSFMVTKERSLPPAPVRHKSDEKAEEVDPQDPATASVTDVRVNIHRENSFMMKPGAATTQLTSSRLRPGTVSYVAWDDTMHMHGQPGVDLPPQLTRIWTEDQLLLFGQTAYHDENLSQITDYLYIGDIYAANNEHLLCRLSVDAIVDISNLRPEEVRKLKACHIPCTCPISANHQRAKLIIGVKDSQTEEIQLYFDEVNRFIESIRRSGRKVLVHSVRGQGRAAVSVIQYLMQIHHLPMQSAFRVTKLARMLKINPVFRETLETLDVKLRTEGKLPPSEPSNRLAPRLHV